MLARLWLFRERELGLRLAAAGLRFQERALGVVERLLGDHAVGPRLFRSLEVLFGSGLDLPCGVEGAL